MLLDQFIGDSQGACRTCDTEVPLQGYLICANCLDHVSAQHLMSAKMLGQQSQNWHAKATHSRGYADNNNVQFQAWCELWTKECFRVLKPGGHLIAFGGTRTWHRLAVAVENVGFEIRDSLSWMYGSGFPKSLNVGKAVLDRHLQTMSTQDGATAAAPWTGWGTTLKPAHEPIILARKPLAGTVATNLIEHSTGAMNIAACRITDGDGENSRDVRLPSNVFLDKSQAELLDQLAGDPASRFFYVAKPSGHERVVVDGVSHPTVKPLTLMRELVRLVTPENGIVLEPFAGSGTTIEACLMEGMDVIAVERDAAFLPLIQHRIDRQRAPLAAARNTDKADVLDLFSDATG